MNCETFLFKDLINDMPNCECGVKDLTEMNKHTSTIDQKYINDGGDFIAFTDKGEKKKILTNLDNQKCYRVRATFISAYFVKNAMCSKFYRSRNVDTEKLKEKIKWNIGYCYRVS
jgi:hypothetical protein